MNMIKKNFSTTELCENMGVTYLQYLGLKVPQLSFLNHAFSTRIGGVSQGVYASMNFRRGYSDSDENVLENFRRFCQAAGFDYDRLVLSQQTHTANVRQVGGEDAGNGILFPNRFYDVDGLVTNEPGITLVTFYADCVPLFFADSVTKSIGLSHAGWRGTVSGMGRATVEKMRECFGSRPEDIYVAIGPSICGECYEVGEEVAEIFHQSFTLEEWKKIAVPKGEGKYLLNLQEANRSILLSSGVLEPHIMMPDICTKCNPDLFFSHRAMGNERRGNLAAFMSIQNTEPVLP